MLILSTDIFSICFTRAPFPPTLGDLLSPIVPLCFITSRTAHPVLVAETHSNQWGQEASVVITMPAASNLICQTVPFSKFNLREIQIIILWLLQLVRLQSRIELLRATGSEENQWPRRKLRVCGKMKSPHISLYKQEMEYLHLSHFRFSLT